MPMEEHQERPPRPADSRLLQSARLAGLLWPTREPEHTDARVLPPARPDSKGRYAPWKTARTDPGPTRTDGGCRRRRVLAQPESMVRGAQRHRVCDRRPGRRGCGADHALRRRYQPGRGPSWSGLPAACGAEAMPPKHLRSWRDMPPDGDCASFTRASTPTDGHMAGLDVWVPASRRMPRPASSVARLRVTPTASTPRLSTSCASRSCSAIAWHGHGVEGLIHGFGPRNLPWGALGAETLHRAWGPGSTTHNQARLLQALRAHTNLLLRSIHQGMHALEVRQEAALGARCAARPPPGVHVADILPIHGLLPTKLTDPSHLRILSGLPMLKARAPGTKPAASKCGGPTEQPDRKIWTGSPLLPGLTVIRLRLRMQPHVIALSGRTMITYTRRDCKRWISCASGI